jgi:hypothetical protein
MVVCMLFVYVDAILEKFLDIFLVKQQFANLVFILRKVTGESPKKKHLILKMF